MKKISIFTFLLTFIVISGLVRAVEEKPLFDFPVDADQYLIRPGDQLTVTFVNSKIQSLTLDVDPEGKIVHETIGIFDLKGKTLSEAKQAITEVLNKLYRFDQIAISITSPRTVTIAIHGAVYRPGIYEGLTSERVSSIIAKAGGISSNGSRRNIIFESPNKKIPVDLDRAEYLGDFSANPNLYAGLSIFVPSKSENTVQIIGEVNNPREIELKKTDDLQLLLAMVGGLKSYADSANITIIRGNKKIKNQDIQSGDVIYVPPLSLKESGSDVLLFGAVNNQGLYPFTSGMTLSDLISSAGGYLSDANGELTTIFRKPRVDIEGRTTELRFPISKPVGGTEDFNKTVLSPKDSVFVPVKVGFVKVSGEVLNPGYFPFKNEKDAKYYILNAGGFLPTAKTETVMIYNPVAKMTSMVSPGVMISDGSEIIVSIREELK